MGSPFIPIEAQRNRAEITAIMSRYGFGTYRFEFWHYNKGDAYDEFLTQSGKPGRIRRRRSRSLDRFCQANCGCVAPLNSEEEIGALIRVARKLDRSDRGQA